MPQDIEGFVDWVVGQKPDLENVEPEVLATLKKNLCERIEAQVNAAIVARLTEGQLPYFEKLLEHGTESQLQSYLNQEISDLPALIAAVLARFKDSYLGA